MDTIFTIIGIIALVVFIIGLTYIFIMLHRAACNDCPFKDQCLKNQDNPSYTPMCMRHYYQNNNFLNF